MKNRILLSLFTVILLLILAACGGGSSEDSSPDKTRSIDHAMGTADVPSEPKKVVVLTNEGTEALLELGITPVGAVQSWTGDPWYDHIKDSMKNVKNVGTESEPNIEAIAELEPDLIIGNKIRQEQVYEQLSEIAPTVFSEELRGDWKVNFNLYANAVNKEQKGKEIIDQFDKRVTDLSEKLGDKKEKKVSVVRFMAGQSRIYYKDSFPGVILGQLGFKYPANQDKIFESQDDKFAYMTESKESIPEMDGDVLFYFTYKPAESEKDASEWENNWTNDPLWKNLKAVKSGNAHKVNDTVWTTAGGVKAANLLLDDIESYFLEK
ncbi:MULTISPECIES: ABC transporter substrate-binding protein [Bacillus]|uniref:Iron siderophore-binding protein n=2 Tax=Bacillus TaxID=1386 RepID=A0A0M5JEC3_9BACI|nr:MULTISPECIES: iron-siderophore ABC transporter substrate-binding protein [Bacillus]ALC82307.1 iron siderophore-binding protein [Bacillus gobiensis]MBP1081169.1 iron complex transport system substrate-binding protein [Bacillus capparidis]MED1095851.1 iron-siderophore ABC transporter substrate-binding protein [Bacillus capparidis]